ncbi:50S ribosomal protein L18 [Candidatus Woesebacteria bacterium GWB1_43_5]|uniref:Large ribosomal subunit protein uL18 n=1 Tax=Candidatus Woesebacteria bacterium GWB1_43_5 TaxID=1802474 RepID=A0A1F7WTF5_9BACT|nr:MAG: 50S ribosomal protein L18 [Candidatus Woesebacteria bacterium GWB1_43_5]
MKNNQKTHTKRKSKKAMVWGTKIRPRLSVYRSSKHIYGQLIDDEKGITLVAVSDKELLTKANKSVLADEVGKLLAKKALAKKIKSVVFDRGAYRYLGRVKHLAQGAREGGLKF